MPAASIEPLSEIAPPSLARIDSKREERLLNEPLSNERSPSPPAGACSTSRLGLVEPAIDWPALGVGARGSSCPAAAESTAIFASKKSGVPRSSRQSTVSPVVRRSNLIVTNEPCGPTTAARTSSRARLSAFRPSIAAMTSPGSTLPSRCAAPPLTHVLTCTAPSSACRRIPTPAWVVSGSREPSASRALSLNVVPIAETADGGRSASTLASIAAAASAAAMCVSPRLVRM